VIVPSLRTYLVNLVNEDNSILFHHLLGFLQWCIQTLTTVLDKQKKKNRTYLHNQFLLYNTFDFQFGENGPTFGYRQAPPFIFSSVPSHFSGWSSLESYFLISGSGIYTLGYRWSNSSFYRKQGLKGVDAQEVVRVSSTIGIAACSWEPTAKSLVLPGKTLCEVVRPRQRRRLRYLAWWGRYELKGRLASKARRGRTYLSRTAISTILESNSPFFSICLYNSRVGDCSTIDSFPSNKSSSLFSTALSIEREPHTKVNSLVIRIEAITFCCYKQTSRFSFCISCRVCLWSVAQRCPSSLV